MSLDFVRQCLELPVSAMLCKLDVLSEEEYFRYVDDESIDLKKLQEGLMMLFLGCFERGKGIEFIKEPGKGLKACGFRVYGHILEASEDLRRHAHAAKTFPEGLISAGGNSRTATPCALT